MTGEMKTIFVFAGTTEGREIGNCLEKEQIKSYMSVATEYGKELVGEYRYVEVLHGRMEQEEMERFFGKHGVELVIDATHPFATVVTGNMKTVCKKLGIPYVRCLREEIKMTDASGCCIVSSVKEAVALLEDTTGNILITTGSRELQEYTKLTAYQQRCYVRVLSTLESVEKAVSCGFTGAHLIAMQGPFSKAMNAATIEQVNAQWFVTKESGSTGGFPEKREAVTMCGAKMIVIKRPEEKGMRLEEILDRIRSRQWIF